VLWNRRNQFRVLDAVHEKNVALKTLSKSNFAFCDSGSGFHWPERISSEVISNVFFTRSLARNQHREAAIRFD